MEKIRNLIKHIKDITKILIAYPIATIIKIKKENRDIWLISERKDEAEDNGYHLFKYLRENHENEKVYYLINKRSKSYSKVERYGNIIQYNSLKHYIYYFLANKHISAFQFFGVPETPFIWNMEKKGILKNKKIFIQHGITKEMLPFLCYQNTNYDLFVCGAKPEYDYIIENYGYPFNNVKYLGFCRFDNLHNYKLKNKILLMPTWRHWFGMTSTSNEEEKREINKFIESEYYKVYNSLINNSKLHEILKKYDMELIFYPHPEMQRFVDKFTCNFKNIKIAERQNNNLQELLKQSKILITDYSSIAFDFAYMKKPLIYYQFDQDRYYSQHFEKGYFDCERDGFGPVIKNEDELVNQIERYICNENNRRKYEKRSELFFEIYDKNNCRRTYEAIKNI